ncbi:hypothetical protein HMPREF9622_01251 [Cutibacterium modestum HL037PA3]|uniref:Uncharacterized protein n=1 Tax=Cutibacterium modestum HL044PA1 TaxID=765109 RepID=A0ABN0C7X3_9ACTN|nr:hypothetical protein HMPREF9621_00864 [Cutibacterium modestum HL037PA2]EFS93367.1 hypothetical protein HMPREF9607_00580 [Cutibacterium modestum HL044PA1]EFT15694.1 hypothetical protein HMPREF9622_01251 [Cutibacterium modestum HL037PA3]EGG26704.1 hypothetical protein PA08_0938 [Cutibacterium modestum P08]
MSTIIIPGVDVVVRSVGEYVSARTPATGVPVPDSFSHDDIT